MTPRLGQDALGTRANELPSACVKPNIPYIPAALRAVVPDAKPTAQEACSVRYLVDQASPMKGGALPTRGVSSYRKLRKPGARARFARLCPFSCFHCGGRALGAPRPARTALPLARSVSLDSRNIEGSRGRAALWENHPPAWPRFPWRGCVSSNSGDD